MMGLHWAFVVAAIFGVFALAIPITLAQQQYTTVDDQGPIIGMVMSLSIRGARVGACSFFSRQTCCFIVPLQALILGLPTHA